MSSQQLVSLCLHHITLQALAIHVSQAGSMRAETCMKSSGRFDTGMAWVRLGSPPWGISPLPGADCSHPTMQRVAQTASSCPAQPRVQGSPLSLHLGLSWGEPQNPHVLTNCQSAVTGMKLSLDRNHVQKLYLVTILIFIVFTLKKSFSQSKGKSCQICSTLPTYPCPQRL